MVTVFFPKAESFRGTLYDPALPAAEIELTQGNGSSFRLSEMRGDVVLLYFGYTFCPDVCPTTLSELNRVVEGMWPDGEQVQVVMVTVDPERDTLEKLHEYVAIFNPNFIGLAARWKSWKRSGMVMVSTGKRNKCPTQPPVILSIIPRACI